MFDLEGAIAQWRGRLLSRAAFQEDDVKELETHLREEIKTLMIAGTIEREAFFLAVREFGDDLELAWRFNQARWEKVYAKRTVMSSVLLGNYVKVAFRNLLKQKAYAVVNIVGLSVGLVCAILIGLFIFHELSFDQHHRQVDHIYRVMRQSKNETVSIFSPVTSTTLANALRQDFPEVLQSVRMHHLNRPSLIKYNTKTFSQQILVADQSVFEVFTVPFVSGNAQMAFVPNTMVITQKMATLVFGGVDPIGKRVNVINGPEDKEYRVTGVIEDVPNTSTLHFDCLTTTAPLSHVQKAMENGIRLGESRDFHTYVLLPKGYDSEKLEEKLPDFIARHMGSDVDASLTYHLQPLSRMHLYHARDYDSRLDGYGDITHVYMFAMVGGLVLVIACVNFVNLSTARATNRIREVGMRKVVGASRSQLIGQFMGESVLTALLALGVALLLAQLVLPYFSHFTSRELRLDILHVDVVLFLVGLTLVVGILSGVYPALYLSSFQAMDVFKRPFVNQSGGIGLRRGMVIFQFAISAVLMVSTFVVYRQLHYMQHTNLGFDKDRIVGMRLERSLVRKYQTVKQEFLKHPNVTKATVTRFQQGLYVTNWPFRVEGSRQDWQISAFECDEDYLDFFSIELLQGEKDALRAAVAKNVGRQKGAPYQFLLNESAVKMLGWENPIGKSIGLKNSRRPGVVAGVVPDFHVQSLHQKIKPVAFLVAPIFPKHLYLKLGPDNIPETLEFIESMWKEFLPDKPFEFYFLDERMSQTQYQNEIRVSRIFSFIALLTVGVACLGLLGLVAFLTERRTKEIGIRKVVGAPVSTIVVLLTKDLLVLVVVANFIAWPIAWHVMGRWLQDFAYRIDFDVYIFLFSGLLSFCIAVFTVGWQAIRAARIRPVDALRYE